MNRDKCEQNENDAYERILIMPTDFLPHSPLLFFPATPFSSPFLFLPLPLLPPLFLLLSFPYLLHPPFLSGWTRSGRVRPGWAGLGRVPAESRISRYPQTGIYGNPRNLIFKKSALRARILYFILIYL